MLTNPKDELSLSLLAQLLESRQLIKQRLNSKAGRFVLEFSQPLLALIGTVNGAARIKPAPAIDRLQTILHTRRVADQIFIGSTKLFEFLLLIIAFVNGLDRADSQQLRKRLGVI